jgi:transposase
MEFRELSDFEWELIKPLLPPKSRVGRLGLMIGAS